MNAKQVVLIVTAVFGALLSLWIVSGWLMHSMMWRGGMMGYMPGPGFYFLPFLLLGLAVMVVAITLLGSNRLK